MPGIDPKGLARKGAMVSPAAVAHGEFYHIYNRGNNREDIFIEGRNYGYFLQLYARHVLPVADTYAYCLLRNHFHVLVRILTPEEQTLRVAEEVREEQTLRVRETLRVGSRRPGQGFGNLFNAYAKAINKAYGRTGSLFEHPFGRVRVTSDAHLCYLVTYIHRNPEAHGLVDDFRAWPHSSYGAMLCEKATHVMRDEVLAWFQGRAGFEAAHGRPLPGAVMAALAPEDVD